MGALDAIQVSYYDLLCCETRRVDIHSCLLVFGEEYHDNAKDFTE